MVKLGGTTLRIHTQTNRLHPIEHDIVLKTVAAECERDAVSAEADLPASKASGHAGGLPQALMMRC